MNTYGFIVFCMSFSIFTASPHLGLVENERRSTSFSVIWKSPLPRLCIYTLSLFQLSLLILISSICLASFASLPRPVSCTSRAMENCSCSSIPASMIQLSISHGTLPCSIALLMSSSVMSMNRPLHGWLIPCKSKILPTKSRIILDLAWSASKSIRHIICFGSTIARARHSLVFLLSRWLISQMIISVVLFIEYSASIYRYP